MSDQLMQYCANNREYFNKDRGSVGTLLCSSFCKIEESLKKSTALLSEVETFAGEYDFDEQTPGNGYRSFIYIFNAAATHTLVISKHIAENRGKLMFRKSVYAKEIDVCAQMIESLLLIGEGLLEMHKIADERKLFARRCHHDNVITRAAKVINQECFYGRAMGFQYYESLRPSVKFVASSMACFSEFYFSNKNILSKTFDLFNMSRKYFTDPELCAQRVCDINENADVRFLSSFLKLCESRPLHAFISFSGHGVEVNRVFEIVTDPLHIYSPKLQKFIDVPIPISHVGVKPIQCRLLSAKRRIDMIGEEVDCTMLAFAEPSKDLILHVHGGGWIAQSSKSHEIYLREWAAKLDVPILSIDYSLTPEAPFPRAIEEVFYAYCWALKNPESVGSTGENIVFVGDSAGGNISTAVVIKCIEMGIPPPKGLFNAYSIYLVNLVKSPARFMGFFDSFLPYGTVLKIFKCYGGGVSLNSIQPKDSSEAQQSTKKFQASEIPKAPDDQFIFEIPKSHLLSPYWAPEEILREFPPTKIVTMITDPCLDDCVDFAKKLKRLNVDTQIDVLGGLFHGFLSFTQVSKECHEGSVICMQRIAELLGLNLESMD